QRRFNIPDIAAAFVELMRDVLGYENFAAQGGDWGSFISAYLGFTWPANVRGIHINLIPLRREPPVASEDASFQCYRKELERWLCEETGYSAIQGSKPQTRAYALTGSLLGVSSWSIEGGRAWSDHDG